MSLLADWDEMQEQVNSGNVTTEELDKAAKAYNEAWDLYETEKKRVDVLRVAAEETEAKLIALMEKAGKKKYFAEGVGSFSFVDRFSVTTPKTDADKQALAAYLQERGGKELFWAKFSVNSQTLNSFYKAEAEIHNDNPENEGKPFTMPGVAAPTAKTGLRLTKEKVK